MGLNINNPKLTAPRRSQPRFVNASIGITANRVLVWRIAVDHDERSL